MLILHLLGCFLLTASIKQRWMSKYIYFPHAAIPVNYTSEFQEILKLQYSLIIDCNYNSYYDTMIFLFIKLIIIYEVGSKSFRPDQLFKVTEIKQLCYFSIQSPFISTHFFSSVNQQLYALQKVLWFFIHLARLLYVWPETFGP